MAAAEGGGVVQGVFSAARGVPATRGVRLNGIVSTCAYVSAYVSICQHTSGYANPSHVALLSVRAHTLVDEGRRHERQHTSAYVSIRLLSIRAHTLVDEGRRHERQHTSAYVC